MNISYFWEFVVLARTRHYSEAADQLFLSQSALSKHIKSMETALGAPLFERTSRRVKLTEFGEMMLPYAQSISRLEHDYELSVQQFLHPEDAPLKVGSIPSIAHYSITNILLQFREEHPTIRLIVDEVDTLECLDRLLNREYELIVFRDSDRYLEHDPEKVSRMVVVPLLEDELMAVLPGDHPLADEESVELSQLADERFALIRHETLPFNISIRACQEAGFTPRIVFDTHNLETILDMVRKGNCVSLLFKSLANFPYNLDFGDRPPFKAIPVRPEIKTTVCLAYRKGERLSPAANHFLGYWMELLSDSKQA